MKIGVFPYLNTLPLLYGLSYKYESFTPSVLSEKMYKGDLDVAILPITEALENPHLYEVFPGMAIAAKGLVKSAKIIFRDEISSLQTLGFNKNSRVANMLARVILKYNYGIDPDIKADSSLHDFELNDDIDGQVLIGDEALFYESDHIDLGEEWSRLCGKPFVYAAWVCRKGFGFRNVYQKLLASKNQGVKNIDIISSEVIYADKDYIFEYLNDCLYYDFGEPEVRGVMEFLSYLKELKIIEHDMQIPFVSL